LIAKLGFGSRNSNLSKNNQIYANLEWSHILFLDSKNNIQIKSQNYFLQSNEYIVNELYRFGGIHSIRGFNENSLQGNVFSSILTEYRYVIAPNLYIHSITDYGYFKDTLSKENNNLLGFGFGFGLLTKNGFLNLIYANGSTKNQSIKLSNSLVHLSFRIYF
jgi:hemolysin activation/secretion protein